MAYRLRLFDICYKNATEIIPGVWFGDATAFYDQTFLRNEKISVILTERKLSEKYFYIDYRKPISGAKYVDYASSRNRGVLLDSKPLLINYIAVKYKVTLNAAANYVQHKLNSN
jgi:hypothetical protein